MFGPDQYESWYAPVSGILAVPLALIGPALVMTALQSKGRNNNLYVQIGLVLLIALSAKNAILIVEVARELRAEGRALLESASEAARARFRPILMTSFAFILGVAPLVVASGAGASASAASRSAPPCSPASGLDRLAVRFVPSFFVVVQGFEECSRRARRPRRRRQSRKLSDQL